MKNISFLILLLIALTTFGQEEPVNPNFSESCTSIMVGSAASTDGSVITSHSCDGNYRTWLNIVPHKTHDGGEMHKVYWGTLHTETSWDLRELELKGEIPEVNETYAYLNVAYPCLNEKQLAIGESTTIGRRELRNKEGMFSIEELQKIALERCTTAREAIKLAGKLVKEYGYGDYGECLTFADPNEVWQFEIFGEGPDKIGAVWAAQRIPDGHVGISANIPRIGKLDLKNKDYFMASENVYEVAKKMGYWDGKETFKFWKAYSGREKPFSIREYFVLSSVAPSLNLSYEADELPFSVKPDKKVSVRDVMKLYRATYEGTEYDMTKNLMAIQNRYDDEWNVIGKDTIKSPIANPFMSWDMRNLINTLNPDIMERYRTIAIAGCSYSHIIQCRKWLPDAIGGVAWFAFDNPAESPRIPIFAGNLNLPKSFEICAQHRYREDAACWHFRRANRLATVKWGKGRELIENTVMELEEKAFEELPFIENKAKELYEQNKNSNQYREYLTNYTNNYAAMAMRRWWELGDEFWHMFGRGF